MLIDLILILAVVIPTVALGSWWLLRPVGSFAAKSEPEGDVPAIVFRGGILDHATDAAMARFPIAIGAHDWEDIHDILAPDYPGFPPQRPLNGSGEIWLKGLKGSAQIIPRTNSTSVYFHEVGDISLTSRDTTELQLLRQINEHLPYPVWKTDLTGAVIWSNAAYSALRRRLPEDAAKTGVSIFTLPDPSPKSVDGAKGTQTNRVKVEYAFSESPEWFSVACHPLSDGAIYHATSLSAVIKAEDAQRDFVQTLAKTFAHLSIGLAIFNRNRQLALFNPALIDLTGLSVSFLSPRPTIDSFFDALRENRRMPEPKNYKTWRHRMADLISAAESGRFEETWSLETGQTYRVTGRPHPDGAIAFLLEDISAEISLTRNFRAELELGQSLVDTFEDALAVFSQSGVLTFSNKAYDLLWGFRGDSSFADVTISDAIQLWREKSAPNPMWQDLRDSVMRLGDREEWSMPVCLKGQKPMQCKILPIASGATVVRFSRQTSVSAKSQPRARKTSD